ncbi:MAG TPA: YkgJ family cysteine cluster protein [Terracidiphilus sp.]|nr:YkgJ family cysteine cluster protein [Terracidiphilus sp.]
MPASPQEPHGSAMAKFALKVQDCNIEVNARIPEGPVLPTTLLPILQGLSNTLSDLTSAGAAKAGAPVSCREGCGACCRQPVPVAPAEARMLAEWIDEQPEERRTVLRERFRQAAARLQESGMAQEVRDCMQASRDARHALGLRYFALGIACPFLEEERCSIHPIRPLRCREYLVVSPAERCATPANAEIVSVKPPILFSQVLEKWNPSGERQAGEFILLTMLDEWAAQHPAVQDRAHRLASEMLLEFLQASSGDRGGTQ